MSKELIEKKLEQIKILLKELAQLLEKPFDELTKDFMPIRAAERNFQLIVDLASDINTHILVERESSTPDTYKQSFNYLAREKVIEYALAEKLAASAQLRNILVHEYDFEEDYRKFYDSAKEFLPAYREYVEIIYKFISK